VTRRHAEEFPAEVLKLFDAYIHGGLSRRGFLERAARHAAGAAGAAAMLAALTPDYTLAAEVAKDDARIAAAYVDYSVVGTGDTIRGYLVHPAPGKGPWPAIVVVHENRGLNPYIEDVARRLAVAGYVAFAPDALSPLGGYPGNEDEAMRRFAALDPVKRTADLLAAVPFLKARPECDGRVGALGFCYGGGIVNLMAVTFPDLAAVVSFYGMQPSAADTAKIRAPLLIHYAGLDERVDSGWPAWKEALDANHVRYRMYLYAGASHGFHNDATPRYDAAAAKLAWSRTLDFLAQYLKGGPAKD
jgi:carboxymethylenebutenolidase